MTSVGYAFKSRKGDVAGAAVLAWALFGIFDRKSILLFSKLEDKNFPVKIDDWYWFLVLVVNLDQDNKMIHYFALGAFIVADIAIVKVHWLSPILLTKRLNSDS